MRKRLITAAAAAAVALVTMPVAAQSTFAQRAPAAIGESEELGPVVILAIATAAAAAVTGIVMVTQDDEPTSP